MIKSEDISHFELPKFEAGKVIRSSLGGHYRIVMDFKPHTQDKRFYIEPLTDDGEHMLLLTMARHHLHENQFSVRETPDGQSTKYRNCIRADFINENLPVLFGGYVDVPQEGEDSIPSPERMEECLIKHPDKYTFKD